MGNYEIITPFVFTPFLFRFHFFGIFSCLFRLSFLESFSFSFRGFPFSEFRGFKNIRTPRPAVLFRPSTNGALFFTHDSEKWDIPLSESCRKIKTFPRGRQAAGVVFYTRYRQKNMYIFLSLVEKLKTFPGDPKHPGSRSLLVRKMGPVFPHTIQTQENTPLCLSRVGKLKHFPGAINLPGSRSLLGP